MSGTILRRPPSVTGLSLAAVGYAGALTPSLLPRAVMFVVMVAALGTLTGYAVGATGAWAIRKIPPVRRWRAPRWLAIVVPAACWIPALAFTPVAVGWQAEQQSALDMPAPLPATVTIIVATAAVSIALLLLARSVRAGSNRLAALLVKRGPLARWVSGQQPSRVHRSIEVVRVGVATLLVLVTVLVLQAGMAWLVSWYDATNADASGQTPGDVGENSGSPDSLAPWDTLGREGRYFVANTMTPASIEAITGAPAQTPVRIYVGMQQGDTPEARTDLAIQELDRVNAWDRKYLVIFGATGTGWVDPNAINALETVTGGDVTTVAVQYSAVPSWIGFVIDQQTTITQNADTIEGVLAAWHEQPVATRPELVLFGQSLGSMGTQGAWSATSTPEDVTADIGHIAWMGPPAASVLWKQWQADRTAGPAWDPVIGDGDITRILVTPSDQAQAATKSPPTIVFAAHANDPVVYWSPDLLLRKPDWLDEPLGPGVMPQMRWIPILTFLQVGMDLISGGEPPEVGHNYSANMGAAIALAVSPTGWTEAKTDALQSALPGLLYTTG